MGETPCYLSMGLNTTIDFKDYTDIEIKNIGKENYRITTILIGGDDTKLSPLIILKGESDKSIEVKYRKID